MKVNAISFASTRHLIAVNRCHVKNVSHDTPNFDSTDAELYFRTKYREIIVIYLR